MKEQKILIFEDEWATISGSFDLANIYAFDGMLKFEHHSKSQEVVFSSLREKYSAVFVDITLAKNTKLDGFNIVKRIVEENLFDKSRMVVLTGNSKVKEKLKTLGVDTRGLRIEYKPVGFTTISSVLHSILSTQDISQTNVI